jgi:hypothetical protein
VDSSWLFLLVAVLRLLRPRGVCFWFWQCFVVLCPGSLVALCVPVCLCPDDGRTTETCSYECISNISSYLRSSPQGQEDEFLESQMSLSLSLEVTPQRRSGAWPKQGICLVSCFWTPTALARDIGAPIKGKGRVLEGRPASNQGTLRRSDMWPEWRDQKLERIAV